MVNFLSNFFIILITMIIVIINTMPLDNPDNETTKIVKNNCVKTSNMFDVLKIYPNAVFPTLIDIGMCSGTCNVNKKIIFEGKEIWEKETNKCTITNFNFLTIYLHDKASNKIVPFQIHELVVNECGCKL
ncbi:Hypothetical protein SRAE_X000082400 [Strongyloides ratti]|uniref:TGF_BETA_2 domain-containing protein n=1 Tax=Strongyloides ratti TaxID=34506 RepID=A0A090LV14_STRRB|nr:Hypothetical protein SRAE_X000082400 [Strongyloides ratti]CEF71499.1 Hypothetical protein SRAE_X000082400 [Strongyloides ratti]